MEYWKTTEYAVELIHLRGESIYVFILIPISHWLRATPGVVNSLAHLHCPCQLVVRESLQQRMEGACNWEGDLCVGLVHRSQP